MSDTSYNEWMKQDYGALIDALEIDDIQKHFMRSRWLDQVMWMESKCKETQQRYYILRLVAIVGGVIVPALVGLKLGGLVDSAISLATLSISLVVAISVAVEEFFHFGERWRHYRRTVELLKICVWQFCQLTGPYKRFADHKAAYPHFAGRVETILQNDIEAFITDIVSEKEVKKEDQG